MMEYDSHRDIFNFPLAINLHGKDVWLMVQADAFTGGMFYIVRGKGITPLHILGVFEDDDHENGKLHLTVMNDDTSSNAFVAAVLQALRQPLDNDDMSNEEPGDMPFE